MDFNFHIFLRAADNLVGHNLLFSFHFAVPASHEPLDRVDRVLGIRHGLALRHLADEALALLREGHDGRGGAAPLRVGDHGRRIALQDGHDGIGRAQIDSNHLAHCSRLRVRVVQATI